MGTSALVLSTLPLLILIDLGSELAFLAVISSLFFLWSTRPSWESCFFCQYFELFSLIMVL